jgi:hypothetical protein
MTELERKRRGWEKSLPELNDEWAYWWLVGDGALLAIVGAADIISALDIVERHHEQCMTILAHRAKLDSFGEVVRDEKRRSAIATRLNLVEDPPP